MGGFGSGAHPRRQEPLIEELFKISLKELRECGFLGKEFIRVLVDDHKVPNQVYVKGDRDGVSVSYDCKGARESQRIEYSLGAQRLGGHQHFFTCPVCAKKRRSLYIHQKVACRVCHGAAYSSENLTLLERARRSRARMAAKLGCRPDDLLPEKPPFMHWSTYQRRYGELLEAQALLARLERDRYGKWEKVADRSSRVPDKTDAL